VQEVCGPRSSDDAFLKCLVKTRQWQDTQLQNKDDTKPWLAYYRTLGHLDAELDRSGSFQQKFREWVNECLQYDQLAVTSWDVWNML